MSEAMVTNIHGAFLIIWGFIIRNLPKHASSMIDCQPHIVSLQRKFSTSIGLLLKAPTP
jgi:hypothetical protein